ncbi:MAG: type II secretion system protein GspK [Candidatus Sumerlaeota bacterium]|nr:type II secretion system protein GspK [Candidatus Sumerlaeota bacterium]
MARRGERGMLLVVVLGIVVLLSLVGYTMSMAVRVHARIADNTLHEAQARYLAESAIEQSMAILMADETPGDGPGDEWMDPTFYEPMDLGDGTYETSFPDPAVEGGAVYGIQDESAKLNLNTATRDQLMLLPGMTDTMADSLLDWIDSDDTPNTLGAESEYYSALDNPYEAKNGPLGSIRELLLVHGFDQAAVYGEDENGNGVLDADEDQDGDGELDLGLLPYVTVYSADRNVRNDGQPRVNIQSASASELQQAMSGLSSEDAQAIVNYRGSHPFQSIGDLLEVTRSGESSYRSPRSLGSSRMSINRGGAIQKSPYVGSSGLAKDVLPKSNRSTSALSKSNRSETGSSSGGANTSDGSGGSSSGSSSGGSSSSSSDNKPIFSTSQLRQWADAITATDQTVISGLVNLNTAPEEVLATLPGLTEDDIVQIGLLREAGSTPFLSVGDLFQLQGMDVDRFRQAAGKVTTRSSQFRIQATGKLNSGQAQKQIEAVVERDENGVHVLYWRET